MHTPTPIMRQLMSLLDRQEKRQGMMLFVLIVVMAFLELLGVSLILPFMDLLTKSDIGSDSAYSRYLSGFLSVDDRETMILVVGCVVIAVTVIANIVKAITTSLLYRFTYMRDSSISTRLLAAYLNRPYAFFLENNSSELAKNVLNEVGILVGGIIITGMLTLSRVIVTGALLLFLFIVNPFVTSVIMVGFGLFYGVIYMFYHRKIENIGDLRHKIAERRFNTVKEAFLNIKENKIYGLKSVFLKNYEGYARETAVYSAKHEIIGQIPRFLVEAVGVTALIAFLLYITLAKGQSVVDMIPMMTLFVLSGYKMLPNLQQIFAGAARIRFTLPVLRTIANELIYDVESNVASLKSHKDDSVSESGFYIQAKGLSFSYPSDRGAGLDDISFDVDRGTVIGIVGRTGAGKTTLIDVLLGLLDVQSGDIVIGGKSLHHCDRQDWYSLFSYVSQHVSLFESSVAYNITLKDDNDEETLSRIETVLKNVDLYDVVQTMPQGMQTPIGENGLSLSGGQRQRLSIARALFNEREILVLDEATSALDAIVEQKILDNIKSNSDKTVFMISHRLSTLTCCDKIMVMDSGHLVAFDTYDQLSKHCALFQSMVEKSSNTHG